MADKMLTREQLAQNIKKAGCAYRWDYPVIKFDRAQIRTCCQVSTNEQITADKMQKHGTDLFLNTDYLVERKLEMLQGTHHSDCGPCWMLEKDNFPSMRASAYPLEKRLQIPDSKTEFSSEDLLSLAKQQVPRMLELQLDNICDLACIYCNPGYSTTWEKKLGVKVEKPTPQEVERFHDLFWDWYQDIFFELNGLCIIGGEPLASPQFFPTLKKLNEIHTTHRAFIKKPQFLSITTNFNTRPEIFNRFLELLDQLKNFFNLSINGSCEAIGEKAEFIREGLDWTKFNTNARSLARFIKQKRSEGHRGRIDFSIHAAQNALSISSLPDLINWANDLEQEVGVAINLIQNIVSYPPYLSAQAVLPKTFSRYCDDAVGLLNKHKTDFIYVDGSRWDEYAKFIHNIGAGLASREPDPEKVHEFKRWFSGLSEQRRDKFKALYPDIYSELVLK